MFNIFLVQQPGDEQHEDRDARLLPRWLVLRHSGPGGSWSVQASCGASRHDICRLIDRDFNLCDLWCLDRWRRSQRRDMSRPATSPMGPEPRWVGFRPLRPVRPYSYYAAPARRCSRILWLRRRCQFPYYGRAYGHPYDPWTWPYMSSGYQNSLNRYYEPPVR